MRISIPIAITLLAFALFLAGCSAPNAGSPPPYQPGGPLSPQTQNADSNSSAPSGSNGSNPLGPAAKNNSPLQPVPLPDENRSILPPAAPNPAASNETANASSPSVSGAQNPPCPGLSGDRLLSCIQLSAVSQKDVSICAKLDSQDLRFRCITYWCSSAGRDYGQCARLTDYNERTGCLNKCNPNGNT